jgi:hypothetical protein
VLAQQFARVDRGHGGGGAALRIVPLPRHTTEA